MKTYYKILFLFSFVYSGLAWFENLYWIWLFNATPNLSHVKRQELYIENLPFTFWVEEPEQLYTKGVIMAVLGLLSIAAIAFLKPYLNKWFFTFFLGQALLIQLFQVWTIL